MTSQCRRIPLRDRRRGFFVIVNIVNVPGRPSDREQIFFVRTMTLLEIGPLTPFRVVPLNPSGILLVSDRRIDKKRINVFAQALSLIR